MRRRHNHRQHSLRLRSRRPHSHQVRNRSRSVEQPSRLVRRAFHERSIQIQVFVSTIGGRTPFRRDPSLGAQGQHPRGRQDFPPRPPPSPPPPHQSHSHFKNKPLPHYPLN